MFLMTAGLSFPRQQLQGAFAALILLSCLSDDGALGTVHMILKQWLILMQQLWVMLLVQIARLSTLH